MVVHESEDLSEARFTRVKLRGAVLTRVDLTGATIRASDVVDVTMRAVDVSGTQIDAPWLFEGSLTVNDVDVVPLVEAELNRRFPGRELRHADDPQGLALAWAALRQAWSSVLAGAQNLPEGSVERQVAGEWSLSQTLRHLVLATDMWLRKAVLGESQPFHPVGLIDTASTGSVAGVAFDEDPSWEQVLAARADRLAKVEAFIAASTAEQLAEVRQNPHAAEYPETVLSCLHTILEEEWEHQRYAVRDLAVLAAEQPDGPRGAAQGSR